MQAALALMHYVTGRLADVAGFELAFWLPALIMIITIVLLKTLEHWDRHTERH
jgi:hypothetical protein